MADLTEFLDNQDIGITSTGTDASDIVGPGLDALMTLMDVFEFGFMPTTSAAGVATTGVGTVAGLSLAYVGPLYGLAGVLMAMGTPYEKAREEIKNDAALSGFSRGFVAGILNMSPSTTRDLFGDEGIDAHTRNVMDPESDAMKVERYNRSLVAGYALANTATPEEKEAFVFEIRKHTTGVSPGEWRDLEKRDYVLEYAAKLRLHYLSKLKPYEAPAAALIKLRPSEEDISGPDLHTEREDAPPPPPYPGFEIGHGSSRRDLVEHIQEVLANMGYQVGVDGGYGDETERAVIAFQTDRGIGVDGVVGPNTWEALFGP